MLTMKSMSRCILKVRGNKRNMGKTGDTRDKAKKYVLWIVVLLWSALIFSFSAQNRAESKKVSDKFTNKIVEVSTDLDKQTIKNQNRDTRIKFSRLIMKAEKIVRKSAHFFLYMVLGILVMILAKCYISKFKILFFVSAGVCFIHSASSECIQYYTPGRSCQWQDVLLNFIASMAGIGLVALFAYIKKGSRKNG